MSEFVTLTDGQLEILGKAIGEGFATTIAKLANLSPDLVTDGQALVALALKCAREIGEGIAAHKTVN